MLIEKPYNHLEKHEVQLPGCEHLLTCDAVSILLHALLLSIREQLASHQTEQVELFHIRVQVDADAFTEKGKTKSNCLYCRSIFFIYSLQTHTLTLAEDWHTARWCTTQVGSS